MFLKILNIEIKYVTTKLIIKHQEIRNTKNLTTSGLNETCNMNPLTENSKSSKWYLYKSNDLNCPQNINVTSRVHD